MITIYRKNNEKRTLTYINEVPSYNSLYDWMAKNLPWTEEKSEIDQQLKKHNKITRHDLQAIFDHKGYIAVEYDFTPEYTEQEEDELLD